MGKQLKGLLYFFVTDLRFSLFVFWSILLGTLMVTFGIAYFLMEGSSGKIGFALSIAVYIYCAITGFLMVKQSIPYSIKVGATRKNIFISLGIFFLGLSIAMGFAINMIQSFMEFVNKEAGVESFIFMHLSHLMDTTWLGKILIDTSIMFFLLSVLFVIGVFFYKYGLIGGGSIIAILTITIFVCSAQGWLIDFIIHTAQTLNHLFFGKVLLTGLIIYSFSWIMMRKITIIR